MDTSSASSRDSSSALADAIDSFSIDWDRDVAFEAAVPSFYCRKPGSSKRNNFNDKRMIMDALEHDAASKWRLLPSHYQTNKEVILHVLRTAKTLPSKSDFERKFPQSLRFDRDVVLAFTQRDDFEELYYERHLYVPDCLTCDKQVMLAYCKKIPRSLQECTEDLCDDRDVVQAAISLDGLELQYASMRLQEDSDIVKKACEKDGRALEFCPPGPVRTTLTADREFMLCVLRQSGGPMLKLVGPELKRDRELLLEALAHGMRFRFCPIDFQTDTQFLLEAVSRKAQLYLELTRALQADLQVGMAAVLSESSDGQVHARALECLPNLRQDRNATLSIAKRGSVELVKGLLKRAPPRFKDDEEIVMACLAKDPKLFHSISPRLQRSAPIIIASMDESTAMDVLRSVSHDTQQAHPEIVITAIQKTDRRSMRYLRTYVPEALWRNKQVAIAWIQRGNRVLDQFEPLLGDREVALEIAQHSWLEFGRVHEDLRSNLAFMREAVEHNGRVLRYASLALRDDFQLSIRAVANDALALHGTRLSREDLQAHVQSKLDLHKTFVNEFLRGIAISTPHIAPTLRSQLPLLDRGVETSQAFKRLIADFLGVPIQEELKLIRQAWNNLTNPPPASEAADAEDMAAAAAAAAADDEMLEDAFLQHRGILERRRFRLMRRGGGGVRAARRARAVAAAAANADPNARFQPGAAAAAAAIAEMDDDDDDDDDDDMEEDFVLAMMAADVVVPPAAAFARPAEAAARRQQD